MAYYRKTIYYMLLIILSIALSTFEGESAHVYVSIGSFIAEGNAERFIERLEKAGFKTFTEKVMVKNKEFTRVTLLQDFGSYKKARRAIRKLMKNPIIRKSGLKGPWIRPGDPQNISRTKISPSLKSAPVFITPENYK